jgi:hypothetical protein
MKAMAEYLAGLTSFSCTLNSRYETVQSNGQKVEFSESRRISLARPDRLRIDEVSNEDDDDDSGTESNDLTLFDGKQITMLSAGFNVYAQAPQPPSVEDAMVYFVRDLRMRAPLALLLSTHVDTEIPNLAKDVDYVERTKVNGQRAHHVAGRAESVDYEFWIADSNKPVPLRVAITYKTAPGQPRFWADLTDWKIKPKFAANTFKLTLPPGARQIPFAVQLSALGAQSPDAQQAPDTAAPGAPAPGAPTPAAPAPGATVTPGVKP